VIGRAADQCQLLLAHRTVSRRHARMTMAGDTLQIEDLGSTNGTAVNGMTLQAGTPAAVQSGTKLKIGDVALTVRHS
jgi:pSer/pThr/pTyr-binding forkhead associated (FHA) protein